MWPFGRNYPYSNLHDLNLDWLISRIRELEEDSAQQLAAILAQGIDSDAIRWSTADQSLTIRNAAGDTIYTIQYTPDGITTTDAEGTTATLYNASSDTWAWVPTSRTVNGKALSSNITLAAADVSAVPITRTVNGKALSSNITLAAADVSAVPITRTVNGKALSSNITLAAADVSAVPTSRTVNGKALSSNITLAAADVSAVPAAGGTQILSGGSLDELTQTPGLYWINGADMASVTGVPWTNSRWAGIMVVPYQAGYNVWQYAYASSVHLRASRYYNGSSWSAWALDRDVITTSAVGLMPAGLWLMTAVDEANKYWCGVVFKAAGAAPVVHTIFNDTITCTGGNTVGTMVVSGGTGTVTYRLHSLSNAVYA